jgi:hypothetical protein
MFLKKLKFFHLNRHIPKVVENAPKGKREGNGTTTK